MKNKLKESLNRKIIILFIVLLSNSLYNCSNEEHYLKENYHKEKKNLISYQQFINETKSKNFTSKLNIKRSDHKTSKETSTVLFEVIDTSTIIKHINKKNRITYSFKLKSNDKDYSNEQTYNLVYFKDNNKWHSSIFQFEETLDQSKTIIIDTQNITKIYDTRNTKTTSRECGFKFIAVNVCNGQCDGPCDNCYLCSDLVITSSCGGGGYTIPEDPEIITPPSDSGGGGSTEDPFEFEPNPKGNTNPVDLETKTPCEKIKTSTSSTQYMNSFNNINKPEVLAQRFEYGFAQVNSDYIFSRAVGTEAIGIPNGAKNYTHTHPNRPLIDEDGKTYHGNVKIHSPDDIYQLIVNCQRNNGSEPTNAFGVMVSDEGIFSLTILEPFIFDQNLQNKWKDFEKAYKRKSEKILSDHINSTQAAERKGKIQQMLLLLLKGLGLENKIGLFEGTVDPTGTTSKINWERKKLDTSGNLTRENC
jgi:hypothetical protein